MRSSTRTLLVQSLLLAVCAAAVGQWAVAFRYPGMLVRPFLDPQERWPEQQVREWAVASKADGANRFRGDFWDYFTRDPERTPPPGSGMVAPADGLFRYHDMAGGLQYVVIALSFWDVHVMRFPCDGLVTGIADRGDQLADGEGQAMVYLDEKRCPVQKIVTLQTERWGEVRIRLITSFSATRLRVFVDEGARVRQGDRLGQILAGSTVVLEMADSIPVAIDLGSRVVAGETVVVAGSEASTKAAGKLP